MFLSMQRVHRGRGATFNPKSRFDRLDAAAADDGWGVLDELMAAPSPATRVEPDHSRTIIARNDSPDIGFDRSINPYRGCEHGCIYCYARPFHGHLGLSSGIDFETRIFAKHDAATLLRAELAKPGYVPRTIAIGTATDPYQPVERRLQITRSVIEVLGETRHPFGIVTKSAAVLRDLDLLGGIAAQGLARVTISVTSLDLELMRTLEPRCSTPAGRLAAIRGLAGAGVPVGVNVAPIIPGLNDHELERILAAAAAAGATRAAWTMVRLPFEVKELFAAWLDQHLPDRAARILSLIRQVRDGRLNDPGFGSRMRGAGPLALLIARRFEVAAGRLGLLARQPGLRTDLFRPPRTDGQLTLF